jgi:hypothetical protein
MIIDMEKQTAVEWFFSELERMQYFIGNDMLEAFEKAKEMENVQVHEYAKFSIQCDRHKFPLMDFEGFLNI